MGCTGSKPLPDSAAVAKEVKQSQPWSTASEERGTPNRVANARDAPPQIQDTKHGMQSANSPQEHNPTTHEISATNVSQQGGLTLPAHAVLPVTTVADTSAPQPSPAVNTQGYIMRDMTHEPLAGHPRYRRIKDINSGASGFVQLAVDLQMEQEVAIKFVQRGSDYLQYAADREILNHRLLGGHAHIVQLKEVFLTERYLAIVMEYVNGGDMADLVDKWNCRNRNTRQPTSTGQTPQGTRCIPEAQARRLFQQLLVALDYLHLLGIANRDIKLENALLAGDSDSEGVELKLCDFGYSKEESGDSLCKTLCGTPEYIAPEVLIDNRYQGKVSDVWSAGVLLYVLLTGVFPFWRRNDEKLDGMTRLSRMMPRIVKGEFLLPTHVSPDCCDILARMLTVDVQSRLSVQDILQHPWFLKDLSPHLISMNSDMMAVPTAERISCSQTAAEIRGIIRTAAAPPSGRGDSLGLQPTEALSAAAAAGPRSSSDGSPDHNATDSKHNAMTPDSGTGQIRMPSISTMVDQAMLDEYQ